MSDAPAGQGRWIWLGLAGLATLLLLFALSLSGGSPPAPAELSSPTRSERTVDPAVRGPSPNPTPSGEAELAPHGSPTPESPALPVSCSLAIGLTAEQPCFAEASLELRTPTLPIRSLAQRDLTVSKPHEVFTVHGLRCGEWVSIALKSSACPERVDQVLVEALRSSTEIALLPGLKRGVALVDAATGAGISGEATVGNFGPSHPLPKDIFTPIAASSWDAVCFSSQGYVPRRARSSPPTHPDEVEVPLQPTWAVQVRCSWSSGAPCHPSEMTLYSNLGSACGNSMVACEPLDEDGLTRCVNSEPPKRGEHQVQAYEQGGLGQQLGSASLTDGAEQPLSLVLEEQDSLCLAANHSETQRCMLTYRAGDSVQGHAIATGAPNRWPETFSGDEALLLCPSGYALLNDVQPESCPQVQLKPFATACVDHSPKGTCTLHDGPTSSVTSPFGVDVTRCNEQVVPGTYDRVECERPGQGRVPCGPLTVQAGETASIDCW